MQKENTEKIDKGFLQMFDDRVLIYSEHGKKLFLSVVFSYACIDNHNDDKIMTSDTVLRKIYLSLYLKGLCVRGGWRPNRTATYWLPLYWP